MRGAGFSSLVVVSVGVSMVCGAQSVADEPSGPRSTDGRSQSVTRAIDDPVAEYLLAGNAQDSSGNGNHGTVNGASPAQDRFGNPNSAYSFDGVAEHVAVPDDDTLDISGGIGIAAWVYPDALPTSDTMILGKSNYTTTTNYILRLMPGGDLQWEYGPYHETTTGPLAAGSWHHVVVMSDAPGGTAEIWVDGSLVSHTTSGSTGAFGVVTDAMSIGAALYSGVSEAFAGRIDDLRVYGHTLTEAEVGTLYGGGVPVELEAFTIQ